ncbi:MAG TPA: hypothetical protein VJ826_04720 [Candidatus Polarisedimenticolaceae bacterium]|nr:hypothetical protein [Candidatus Polarisedimenticolaceae bacterium]
MTKRVLRFAFPLAAATVIATLAFSAAGNRNGAAKGGGSEVQRGIDIAPVHLNLAGKSPSLVALGSYIVNAQGGCNDCHTCPPYAEGHDPFAGQDAQVNAENYLAGGTSFGPFVSANITPDENGLPHGLTLEEFIQAIRTGHDPDEPEEILQVMPWPVFRNMTDRDLTAVYTYLTAIPHAERNDACVPEGDED